MSSEETWWWTLRPTSSRCDNCLELIPARATFAYRHATQEGYCEICVDAAGLVPQVSRRLAREQLKPVKPSPLTGKSRSQKAARREAVTKALRSGPATTHEVAARTGLPIMLAGAALGRLQVAGQIVRASGGDRRWRLVENRGIDQPALGDRSSAASPGDSHSAGVTAVVRASFNEEGSPR